MRTPYPHVRLRFGHLQRGFLPTVGDRLLENGMLSANLLGLNIA